MSYLKLLCLFIFLITLPFLLSRYYYDRAVHDTVSKIACENKEKIANEYIKDACEKELDSETKRQIYLTYTKMLYTGAMNKLKNMCKDHPDGELANFCNTKIDKLDILPSASEQSTLLAEYKAIKDRQEESKTSKPSEKLAPNTQDELIFKHEILKEPRQGDPNLMGDSKEDFKDLIF